jgi:hypothetical protein
MYLQQLVFILDTRIRGYDGMGMFLLQPETCRAAPGKGFFFSSNGAKGGSREPWARRTSER